MFDVLITGPGPFDLQATHLDRGGTTIADVDITGGLRRAVVSVEDLAVGGLTFDIDVTWVGFGDLARSKSRETFNENGTMVRFSDDSRFRSADATAVVNGERFSDFKTFGQVSFLGRSRLIEVCRGDGDSQPV